MDRNQWHPQNKRTWDIQHSPDGYLHFDLSAKIEDGNQHLMLRFAADDQAWALEMCEYMDTLRELQESGGSNPYFGEVLYLAVKPKLAVDYRYYPATPFEDEEGPFEDEEGYRLLQDPSGEPISDITTETLVYPNKIVLHGTFTSLRGEVTHIAVKEIQRELIESLIITD